MQVLTLSTNVTKFYFSFIYTERNGFKSHIVLHFSRHSSSLKTNFRIIFSDIPRPPPSKLFYTPDSYPLLSFHVITNSVASQPEGSSPRSQELLLLLWLNGPFSLASVSLRIVRHSFLLVL
jgi:hypothetical protein